MVLNCCQSDWAGFSHDNANALRSVGIDCEDVIEKSHVFRYAEQGIKLKTKDIQTKMRGADIIQIMHSDIKMLNMCRNMGKRVIVYHTGTDYRKGFRRLNALFNPYVERSVIALGEFSGMGAKHETYIVGAIDTDKLYSEPSATTPYHFAHYPSNKEIKGTSVIEKVVKEAYRHKRNFYFTMNVKRLPHPEHIRRVKECDIYIEMLALTQNGFNYGSFGISALEAAALGKVVVTNHVTEKVYEKEYGFKTPFVIANSEKELEEKVRELSEMPEKKIRELQAQTREWVVNTHSYKATGERLKKLL